ncbi:TnsA-like heteromeric transposase endonuclease subunit [Mycobacterium sp.]|uniref:TnsA-like heteromeric transposase endonuclease subunit n=1 Tax=Mycobacterium sp. TaxID=1785 RepID=UPI003C72AE4C
MAPWRTFHWRYGQRHYSGSYWSATQDDLVVYESRLELTRLIYADFDQTVSHVVAQPFLIEALVAKKQRRHVPDFFLTTPDGPIVVDVKPVGRLQKPEIAFTLAWTRRLVQQRGWRYEIWSEPPRTELSNLRFLAGYRDERRFNRDLVQRQVNVDLDGCSIEEAISSQPDAAVAIVRSVVLHLIWRGHFTTDLSRPLSSKSRLHQRRSSE